MKQNQVFGLVWTGWTFYSIVHTWIFCTFYKYFEKLFAWLNDFSSPDSILSQMCFAQIGNKDGSPRNLYIGSYFGRKTRILSDQCGKIDRWSFPTTAKHVWSILNNTFFGHDKFTQRSFPYSATRRNMQRMQCLRKGFEAWRKCKGV
jgi:hypothetical protein